MYFRKYHHHHLRRSAGPCFGDVTTYLWRIPPAAVPYWGQSIRLKGTLMLKLITVLVDSADSGREILVTEFGAVRAAMAEGNHDSIVHALDELEATMSIYDLGYEPGTERERAYIGEAGWLARSIAYGGTFSTGIEPGGLVRVGGRAGRVIAIDTDGSPVITDIATGADMSHDSVTDEPIAEWQAAFDAVDAMTVPLKCTGDLNLALALRDPDALIDALDEVREKAEPASFDRARAAAVAYRDAAVAQATPTAAKDTVNFYLNFLTQIDPGCGDFVDFQTRHWLDILSLADPSLPVAGDDAQVAAELRKKSLAGELGEHSDTFASLGVYVTVSGVVPSHDPAGSILEMYVWYRDRYLLARRRWSELCEDAPFSEAFPVLVDFLLAGKPVALGSVRAGTADLRSVLDGAVALGLVDYDEGADTYTRSLRARGGLVDPSEPFLDILEMVAAAE